MYFRDATRDTSVSDLLPKADSVESELLSLGFTQLGVVHGKPAGPIGSKSIERQYRGSDAALLNRQQARGIASLVFVHLDRQTFACLTDWIDGPLLTLRTVTQDLDILETTRRPTRAPERSWTAARLLSNPFALRPRLLRWSRPADGYSLELFEGNATMQAECHWRRLADTGLAGVVSMPTYLKARERVFSLNSTTLVELSEQRIREFRSWLWRVLLVGSIALMLDAGWVGSWAEVQPLIILGLTVVMLADTVALLYRTRNRIGYY
jgi:hypothetical protein